MSDVVGTTQELGAPAGQEAQFQSFWDNPGATEAERPRNEDAQAAPVADEQQEQAADPNAVAQQQQTEEADDTPQYASLTELLTAHKIDPESVMGLHVTTKIDGVETQVPLSDGRSLLRSALLCQWWRQWSLRPSSVPVARAHRTDESSVTRATHRRCVGATLSRGEKLSWSRA
ncbi:hypothetical protein [Burkholderia sp. MSMB1078WGS]|uniref:hypothetical protein n=1 Tax=Burkholderia sp. MSMB1078WGS TaxID=1637900 RepID=UPI0012E3DC13|nr:hypothetical protein [Burkholderia sp. MSMB1078WGS]